MDKATGKIYQKDLRKLMAEKKHLSNLKSKVAEKITSPLIKYDSKGNLSCILCRSNIKSAVLWKVHINSKQHKKNVEEAKTLKEDIINATKNRSQTVIAEGSGNKKILCTSSTPSENKNTIIAKQEKDKKSVSNALPELFFDEPLNKNKFTKDSLDEEWELFQREIKEATIESNIIIAEEQNEAYVDRQIDEIDEQIHHWSKVLNLEEKFKRIHNESKLQRQQSAINEIDNNNDVEILDDLLDWRYYQKPA